MTIAKKYQMKARVQKCNSVCQVHQKQLWPKRFLLRGLISKMFFFLFSLSNIIDQRPKTTIVYLFSGQII